MSDHWIALVPEDPRFCDQVRLWIAERGEVSALIQYHAAGGNKSFEFFTTLEAFRTRLEELPALTAVTVYERPQLPLRGVVDDMFISKAIIEIPDGAEYLIAGLEIITFGRQSWLDFIGGEGTNELITELRRRVGTRVAIGTYPSLDGGVDAGVICAIVPTRDGDIVGGIY